MIVAITLLIRHDAGAPEVDPICADPVCPFLNKNTTTTTTTTNNNNNNNNL